jgi:hypothetical protein
MDTKDSSLIPQQPIGKIAGSRKTEGFELSVRVSSKNQIKAWRKAFPTPFVPRGVYKFNSHEEADDWLWKMMTRKPNH